MSGEAIDDVIDVTNRRSSILETLSDGPRDKRTLISELDCSRSTVSRGLEELLEQGLLTTTDGQYELTMLGRCIFRLREYTRETIEALLAEREAFTTTADSEFLSPQVALGADISTVDPAVPFQTLSQIQELTQGADRIRAAVSAFDTPSQFEQLYDALTNHAATVELLTTRTLLGQLCDTYEDKLVEMARSNRFWLLVSDQYSSCLRCIVRGDERVVVATVRDEDGRPCSLLVNSKPSAFAAAEVSLDNCSTDAVDVTAALRTPGLSPEDVCNAELASN